MPPAGGCPFGHTAAAPAAEEGSSTAAGGRCPVDHASPADQGAAGPGKCPVDRAAAGGLAGGSGRCPFSGQASATAGRRGMGEGARCPVGHAAPQTAAEAGPSGRRPVAQPGAAAAAAGPGAQQAAGAQPAKAVCPFGYSAEQPTLPELHCPRCRSLFHECVLTACGHRFCAACAGGGAECLQCGDAVGQPQPDAETRGRVEAFIARHGAGAAPAGPLRLAGSQDAGPVQAAFLLEVGLRSLLGGNAPAAAARLAACRRLLLAAAAVAGGAGTELGARLGAVCGAQGDAEAVRGRPGAAAACYREGLAHLQACEPATAEVRQAVTVTLNKLGDLHFRAGELPAARQQYRSALDIRRRAAAEAGGGSARAQLDLALSLAKVADIEQALGAAGEAGALLREAQAAAAALEARKQDLDAPSTARLAALAAFLAQPAAGG